MLPSVAPRLTIDSALRVFPGVWKPLFFKTPFLGWISIPTSFVSLFIFYIFSYLLLKTMGCFSGCLISSASIRKLFCGIYSVFKCSFDEFVREKVVSPSYSSANFSSTTVLNHRFFGTWLSLWSNSHQYMTTDKTIALSIWNFVSKVTSLLFNTLSRFVIPFLVRSKHLLILWLHEIIGIKHTLRS